MAAMGDLASWPEAWESASHEPPRSAHLIADSEAQLRALALALKPTGWPLGAMSAAAGAGLILAGLRLAGWDITSTPPACS